MLDGCSWPRTLESLDTAHDGLAAHTCGSHYGPPSHFKFGFREMGPARTGKVLLKMNQDGGFDCPSCAWPDPDSKRKHAAEFCENGAKAVAWEATRKRVPRSFFAEHSIDQLNQISEFGRLSLPALRPGLWHEQPAGLRHRRRARAEDRIRCAKDTGLTNLPLHDFTQNQIWCAIVALACELTAWMQLLAFTGDGDGDSDGSHEARRWEPKRLRLRLFSTAARIARSGRRVIVHLARDSAWTNLLLDGLTRLRALATPG